MAGDTIGEAWVAIRPDTSQFANLLSSGLSGPLADVNKGALIVLGSVVALGAVALKLNSQYSSALSMIEGRMNITAKAGNAIGAAFLSTAGKATFSALEIAQAFAPVAGQLDTINGGALTASQSLNFMNNAMALAEATATPLAKATSDLSSIIQTFGLNLSDASGAADVLYNTSNALGVPIDTLTTSLERARSSAGAAAPTLSDLSTFILDLAEHGETGRQAMTLLNTALTGIETPTAKVLAYQKELGVSFLTSTGQLKSLGSIIGIVHPIIDGMGNAQATATLKALGFGSASSKLVGLIEAGQPAWDTANKTVEKSGTAAGTAKTNTDNLGGAWKKLQGNITDMLTKAGTPLNTFLTNLVNYVNQHLKGALEWAITNFNLLGIVAGIVVSIFTLWKIGTLVAGIYGLAAATWAAVGPWGLLAAAVAAAVAGIAWMITHKNQLFPGGPTMKPILAGGGGLLGGGVDSVGPVFGVGLGKGLASGGPIGPGGALVGEMGPEFFVPGRSGTIIPNHALGGIGGISQNLYFYGTQNIPEVQQAIELNNRKFVLALRSI